MRVPLVFPTPTQRLSSFFCILNPIHHFFAVWQLCSALLVLRPQALKFILYLVPVVRPVVVLFVQDQPDLKAWIRPGYSDTAGFARKHRFFISLMFVPIKHRPNLILFFK